MDINITGFIPALLPVALSPGASFSLVMSSALTGGRKGLFKTLGGTAPGIYTHATLIGLGTTAVIASSPALFGLLKMAGTLYLFWLGFMLIRSGLRPGQAVFSTASTSVTLKEAWAANVLNPKAIIFYLTVVSQFAGNQGGLNNFLVLASVHVIVMSVWILLVSYLLIFSVSRANPLMLKNTLIFPAECCWYFFHCITFK